MATVFFFNNAPHQSGSLVELGFRPGNRRYLMYEGYSMKRVNVSEHYPSLGLYGDTDVHVDIVDGRLEFLSWKTADGTQIIENYKDGKLIKRQEYTEYTKEKRK